MFDIGAAVPHNLGTKVEAGDRVKTNRNLLLWPFALLRVSHCQKMKSARTYSAKLVSLHRLFLFPAAKTTFVNELGQFLLHQLFNLCNGLIQTFFCRASNMEIERWILKAHVSLYSAQTCGRPHTEGVAMFLSG